MFLRSSLFNLAKKILKSNGISMRYYTLTLNLLDILDPKNKEKTVLSFLKDFSGKSYLSFKSNLLSSYRNLKHYSKPSNLGNLFGDIWYNFTLLFRGLSKIVICWLIIAIPFFCFLIIQGFYILANTFTFLSGYPYFGLRILFIGVKLVLKFLVYLFCISVLVTLVLSISSSLIFVFFLTLFFILVLSGLFLYLVYLTQKYFFFGPLLFLVFISLVVSLVFRVLSVTGTDYPYNTKIQNFIRFFVITFVVLVAVLPIIPVTLLWLYFFVSVKGLESYNLNIWETEVRSGIKFLKSPLAYSLILFDKSPISSFFEALLYISITIVFCLRFFRHWFMTSLSVLFNYFIELVNLAPIKLMLFILFTTVKVAILFVGDIAKVFFYLVSLIPGLQFLLFVDIDKFIELSVDELLGLGMVDIESIFTEVCISTILKSLSYPFYFYDFNSLNSEFFTLERVLLNLFYWFIFLLSFIYFFTFFIIGLISKIVPGFWFFVRDFIIASVAFVIRLLNFCFEISMHILSAFMVVLLIPVLSLSKVLVRVINFFTSFWSSPRAHSKNKSGNSTESKKNQRNNRSTHFTTKHVYVLFDAVISLVFCFIIFLKYLQSLLLSYLVDFENSVIPTKKTVGSCWVTFFDNHWLNCYNSTNLSKKLYNSNWVDLFKPSSLLSVWVRNPNSLSPFRSFLLFIDSIIIHFMGGYKFYSWHMGGLPIKVEENKFIKTNDPDRAWWKFYKNPMELRSYRRSSYRQQKFHALPFEDQTIIFNELVTEAPLLRESVRDNLIDVSSVLFLILTGLSQKSNYQQRQRYEFVQNVEASLHNSKLHYLDEISVIGLCKLNNISVEEAIMYLSVSDNSSLHLNQSFDLPHLASFCKDYSPYFSESLLRNLSSNSSVSKRSWYYGELRDINSVELNRIVKLLNL